MEIKIAERERGQQRQWEQSRIDRSKYNKKYKEIKIEEEGPRYLQRVNLNKLRVGKGIRALIKLRRGNLEEANKYWLEDSDKACVFCGKEQDNMRHYVLTCQMTKSWLEEMGKEKVGIWNKLWNDELDRSKGNVLWKLWSEKEKKLKEKKEVKGIEREKDSGDTDTG